MAWNANLKHTLLYVSVQPASYVKSTLHVP